MDEFRPYRSDRQAPPDYRPLTNVAGLRFDHVFEVDPGLMAEHVTQQPMPNWDLSRIVRSRTEHLNWMSSHWAEKRVSGAAILAELDLGQP
jgi:hypothetical protein